MDDDIDLYDEVFAPDGTNFITVMDNWIYRTSSRWSATEEYDPELWMSETIEGLRGEGSVIDELELWTSEAIPDFDDSEVLSPHVFGMFP